MASVSGKVRISCSRQERRQVAAATGLLAVAELRAWAGLADVDLAAVDALAVQAVDRGAPAGFIGHLDEAEAPAAARVLVLHDFRADHCAKRLKRFAQAVVGSGIGKVANVEVHFLLPKLQSCSRQSTGT